VLPPLLRLLLRPLLRPLLRLLLRLLRLLPLLPLPTRSNISKPIAVVARR
jgi:hypothetical protein